MHIYSASAAPFFKNGFVVACEETREAVVIDPGDEVDELIGHVVAERLLVRSILLTHAHLDHVTGVGAATRAFGVKVWLHRDDVFLYNGVVEQGRMFGLHLEQPPPVDAFYSPGTPLFFGRYQVDVLPTPGHCPGGVCLAIGRAGTTVRELFVGDTLFAGSIGRTDLPSGDYDVLMHSIRSVLLAFPDDTPVYSGHGPETTIGRGAPDQSVPDRRFRVTLFFLPSLVGLMLQAAGALFFASLCVVLTRPVRRGPLSYWATGWFALFAALAALWLSFYFPAFLIAGQRLYLLGEYVFGYLLIVGCRRYATGQGPARHEIWLVVPATFLALWLPHLGGGDFNVFFTVHTLIYTYLFVSAFRVLLKVRPHPRSVAGVRMMQVALALLALDYLHYAPLFWASSKQRLPLAVPYLEYAPFYDLFVLVMLMFGMVMLVTGDAQRELEEANVELERTRDRLEVMAHLDHLTSALTRHAFYSLIEDPKGGGRAVLRGCAAMADIDNLKSVNDRYGHPAGDAAIRAVAAAIRSCIRADDLLFRWGGDEFLVLLIGVSESDARARLEGLNARLRQTTIVGVPVPVDLSASMGFAPFESATSLDEVIALADTAMYGMKKASA